MEKNNKGGRRLSDRKAVGAEFLLSIENLLPGEPLLGGLQFFADLTLGEGMPGKRGGLGKTGAAFVALMINQLSPPGSQ